MQFLESECDVYEGPPDVVLIEEGLLLLVRDDLLIEVAIVGVLHDDAAWGRTYQRELDCLYPMM
jgi:hypothetical protein